VVKNKTKITKPLKVDVKNEKKILWRLAVAYKIYTYMPTENNRDKIDFDPLPFFTVCCRHVF